MSGTPNSRAMNEFEVICPIHPARIGSRVPDFAKEWNCSMNGTVNAYVPLQ